MKTTIKDNLKVKLLQTRKGAEGNERVEKTDWRNQLATHACVLHGSSTVIPIHLYNYCGLIIIILDKIRRGHSKDEMLPDRQPLLQLIT